jgi:hypothetical protein
LSQRHNLPHGTLVPVESWLSIAVGAYARFVVRTKARVRRHSRHRHARDRQVGDADGADL